MGMMGVFLWTIGSAQTEEGEKKMTNRCHICGRMKSMTEATICDSCRDAMKRNGYIKVLQCKDCVNAEILEWLDNAIICKKHSYTGVRPDDFYCADGERKGGEVV